MQDVRPERALRLRFPKFLGFRGLGFRVEGSGLRVQGLGFRVP